MPKLIRPPNQADVTRFMRMLFLRTEKDLIQEITRKRNTGLVEYAEAASLERVQKILQNMVDESWSYVPQMIETIFYRSDKDAAGYRNARTLTAPQTAVVQQLADNLLGELTEAAEGAKKSAETVFTIARLEKDPLRETALKQVLRKEAAGKPWIKTSEDMLKEMKANGITVFVDKAGRRWNMETYCNMVTRTTARQAQVAALLTADDYDLWQIVKIGSTCPVCAALEGRVYSKSGTDPDYPPLSLAFGKVDPTGSDDLTNTYLNIHPNCLVPGGSVLCEGLMSASRRYYTGDVISLETASGNKITVTPNHPILTTKGFVAAGFLNEGDKIIEATVKYAAFLRKAPDNVYIPTGVEEIFHSVVKSGDSPAFRVKGSPVQFHGDGIANRKVDIVFPASLGVSEWDVAGGEPVTKKDLPSTHFRRLLLFANSAATKILVGAFFSFYSFVCSLGFVRTIKAIAVNSKEFSNLRHGTPASFGNLSIGHPLIMKFKEMLKLFSMRFKKSRRNIIEAFPVLSFWKKHSEFCLSMFKSLNRNPVISGDLGTRDAFIIKGLEKLLCDNCFVVSVLTHTETSFYNGYVYNLETKPHYYTYNNIVTHNCLHSLIKYTTIGKTEKQIQKDKDFSDPDKNPLDRDPRTKKQIKAYREKERNRRKLLQEKRKEKQQEQILRASSEKGITNKRELKDSKYKVNLNEINSNDYLKKFRGITGKSVVDENICKYARAGLTHRNGTAKEDLYILSSETGEILGKNVSGTDDFGVRPNQSITKAVKENQGALIGLHTHPDGTPPTGSDFETAFKRRYNMAVVAGADGSVYTYGCREQYVTARLIDDTIEKFKKALDSSGKKIYLNDIEAHLAALRQLRKDYGIWYEAR